MTVLDTDFNGPREVGSASRDSGAIPFIGGGIRQLLTSVGEGLHRGDADLVTVLEKQLLALLGAQGVHLREVPLRSGQTVGPQVLGNTLTATAPSTNPRLGAALTVTLAPGQQLGPDATRLLREAAPLAGLIVSLARRQRDQPDRGADGAAPLIGATRLMQSLRHRVERVAVTEFTVLVEGESGTGKELVARQIHDLSGRCGGPFVAVNCAALVETLLEAELFGIEDRTATGVRGRRGKFEHAAGGTLFLDEVADLSLSAQAKLLRALQDLTIERVGATGGRRLNVRVVAATNKPLAGLVERGLFRSDLYYRLAGVEIAVPPLRARREDIIELARYFLARHRPTRALEFGESALEALRLYVWPGNVRELERVVEHVVALAEGVRIEVDDLPSHVCGAYTEVLEPSLEARETMRAWGSRYAWLVLERCGGNKRRTCHWLDVSYHTLEAYLRYGRHRSGDPPRQLPTWAKNGPQLP